MFQSKHAKDSKVGKQSQWKFTTRIATATTLIMIIAIILSFKQTKNFIENILIHGSDIKIMKTAILDCIDSEKTPNGSRKWIVSDKTMDIGGNVFTINNINACVSGSKIDNSEYVDLISKNQKQYYVDLSIEKMDQRQFEKELEDTEDDAFDLFKRKYPGFNGYFVISRPGYSPDGNRALVVIEIRPREHQVLYIYELDVRMNKIINKHVKVSE